MVDPRRALELAALLVVWLGAAGFAMSAAGDGPVRVVVQSGWAAQGWIGPDGALGATCHGGYRGSSVRLVDLRRPALAWSIPLEGARAAAFSPDGTWLAACGEDCGLLLDLRTCELSERPVLRGALIAFAPDSQRLVVVRRDPFRMALADDADKEQGLLLLDLSGRVLARHEVKFEVPQVVEFLDEGKSVRLRGLRGNPMREALRMGDAEQTIELDSGRSVEKLGPIERGRPAGHTDPAVKLLPQSSEKLVLAQSPRELLWDARSGLCVLSGSGRPEGGVSKVFDLRAGRFVRTLGKNNEVHNIGGFLGAGAVLANVARDRQRGLASIELRSGEVAPLRPAARIGYPAPDGRHFAAVDFDAQGRQQTLRLYAVPPGEPLCREEANRGEVGPSGWSREGKWFLRSTRLGEDAEVRLIRAADGVCTTIRLAAVVAQHAKTTDPADRVGVWCFDLDDATGRLAIGMGGATSGLAVWADAATGEISGVLEGFPVWVSAVRLVGRQQLLTATCYGRAQLWDLARREPLWTTETKEDVVQLDTVPGGPYAICGRSGRGGSVLRLSDGQLLRRTPRLLASDSAAAPRWFQPQLIGDGRWTLELDPETLQARLTAAATGEALLSFALLPDDQWIIFTPDGHWDGSERVYDWVRFYRRLAPLEAAAADALRGRAAIEAALGRVFSR